MQTDPKIENIKIEKLQFSFDEPPFNAPDIKAKIISLMPTVVPETISFYIKNANTAIANGIRRVISGEMKVKILTCDLSDIDTDEDFIKRSELIDRINYVPINQNISSDAIFSLMMANTDPKKEFLVIHSSDIIPTGNVQGNMKLFPETMRIAELRPGKYLTIPKIKVVENFGFVYSAHCLTNEIEYYITDFIPVVFVNERANFIGKYIKVSELLTLFKKLKIKYDESPDDLFRKTILIIPNKSYQHQLDPKQKERIKKFNIVVENPESYKLTEMNQDDQFLKGYQSTEMYCRNFFLSFTTNGNIDPKKMIWLACENIKERLTNIKNATLATKDEEEETAGLVSIMQDNIKTKILIRGEDYTIGHLLRKTIFELDPSIGLVNDSLEHPTNRTIIINIRHPQPIKIFIDAIDECIKNFSKIQASFV